MAIVQNVVINTRKAVANIKRFNENLKNTLAGAKKAGSALDRFKATAVGAFAAIVAYRVGAHLVAEFREAVRAGLEFSKAMGEIETLMPEAERNTNRLRRSLIDLSNQFGQDATTQARGFYDVVSAGVQGFSNQLDVLNVTNKVAIGGITDTATATNVLVTTMNAFENQGANASQVADVLFTTVKQGVTTIPQLASSLGQVNAIASTAGVTLGEVGASMAVLTKNGLSTAESATALKAAIVSFSKPTAKARQIINRLGIDFSTAAIQQKGFANVLRQVREATKGNVTVLQQLFPNVRAQAALMPLLTSRWSEFEKQLVNFKDTTGAADQAFERISRTASFQSDRLSTSFKNVWVAATSIVDEPLAHWLEGAASWFQRTSLVTKVTIRLLQGFVQGIILIEQAWVGALIVIQSVITALAQVGRLFGGVGKTIADSTNDALKGYIKRAEELYKMQGRVAKATSDFLSGAKTEDKVTGKLDKYGKALRDLETRLNKINGKPVKVLKELPKVIDVSLVDTLTKMAGFSGKISKIIIRDSKNRTKEEIAQIKDLDERRKSENELEQNRIKLKNQAAEEIGGLIKGAFGEYKAFQIAEATIATYSAANKALAAYPPPFSFVAAAAAVAAGIANVIKIKNQSFQQGGIVPGNQFEGDRVVARVNSGELILNRGQQQNLFNAINEGNLGGGGANVTVNVSSITGDIPQRSLDRMIDQIRERVVNGNKRFI